MTQHETVLQALLATIAGDPFFGPVDLDAPEPSTWRTGIEGVTAGGLSDHCTVQDGHVTVTRDGGAENDWELELEASVVYAVQCADRTGRRARRDEGAARISALIRNNRQLGLDDAQIYAEIGETVHDDNVPVKATAPVAIVEVMVKVQYVAESEAG